MTLEMLVLNLCLSNPEPLFVRFCTLEAKGVLEIIQLQHLVMWNLNAQNNLIYPINLLKFYLQTQKLQDHRAKYLQNYLIHFY